MSSSLMRGRISSIRILSSKLVFIEAGDNQIILKGEYLNIDKIKAIRTSISIGDIAEFKGEIGQSKSGRTSMFAQEVKILAKCAKQIPHSVDDEISIRKVYLDMIVNDKKEILLKRSRLTKYLRELLDGRGFVEIETPILAFSAGGANARVFETRVNCFGQNGCLRISPELYLKQLVVGGINKVYEIGKQFRNEGIDSTHSPEFTTLEFYEAFTNLKSTMEFTEEIIRGMCEIFSPTGSNEKIHEWQTTAVVANLVVNLKGFMCSDKDVLIDLSKSFAQIDIVPELEKHLGKLPNLNDLESIPYLLTIFERHKLDKPTIVTLPRLLDKLIAQFIENQCVTPTFILGHPICMSPLASERQSDTCTSNTTKVASRFELFIGCKEIVNAYTELSDPVEQRRRFNDQLLDSTIDNEIRGIDEAFIESLEFGLPPTVGFGMGFDRICMILTGKSRIRDVMAFPLARPLNKIQ